MAYVAKKYRFPFAKIVDGDIMIIEEDPTPRTKEEQDEDFYRILGPRYPKMPEIAELPQDIGPLSDLEEEIRTYLPQIRDTQPT